MKFKNLKIIKFLIFQKFGIKKKDITLNSKIFNQLIYDSLDFLEFIIVLEKLFKIEISDSFKIKTKTIKEILNYIKNQKRDIA
jgi:acyl carrier protein